MPGDYPIPPRPQTTITLPIQRTCTHADCGLFCRVPFGPPMDTPSDAPYAAEGEAMEVRDRRMWAVEQVVSLYAGEGPTVDADALCALATRLLKYVDEGE